MRNANGAADGQPDESTIRRAQRGDATALDAVCRAVLPRLRRWARTHVQGTDEADDVAQAALIAATRGLPAFDARAALDTWLYRIVRRCVADHHRTVRRRTRLAQLHEGRTIPGRVEVDVGALDARRAAGVVRREFHRLPDRQREIFDLVDLQGIPAEEVAAMLELASATVRVHLLRARRALRRIMLEMEPALAEDLGGLHERT